MQLSDLKGQHTPKYKNNSHRRYYASPRRQRQMQNYSCVLPGKNNKSDSNHNHNQNQNQHIQKYKFKHNHSVSLSIPKKQLKHTQIYGNSEDVSNLNIRHFVQSKIIKVDKNKVENQTEKFRLKNKIIQQTKFKNIIKLPAKYENQKRRFEQKLVPVVSRMCRHFHNQTEITGAYNHNGQCDQTKKQKHKTKLKRLHIKSQSSLNTDDNLQICFPNSYKKQSIFLPNPSLNLQVSSGRRAQVAPSTPIANLSNFQADLQLPVIKSVNPLLICTQYSLPQYSSLTNQICSSFRTHKQKLKSIFSLPSKLYEHVYISHYQALQPTTINLQSMLSSPAFQILRFPSSQSSLESQCIYFGEIRQRKQEGYGIFLNSYELRQGVWENGFMIRGIIKNSRQFYKGQVGANGKNGQGECLYQDGTVYEGQWQSDKEHGYGVAKSERFSYLGDWVNGVFEGKGVLKTHFSSYIGTFLNGEKQGFSKQTFQNGDFYQGNFQNNYPNGQGKYKWKTGQQYIGQFHQGKRQGFGTFIAPGVVKYEGYYKNDKPSGQGKAYYINGDQYHGQFFQGERNGLGDLICKNIKVAFSGDWVNDQLVYRIEKK